MLMEQTEHFDVPKHEYRQYSQEEIDEARGNLSLMNDRVFMVAFEKNKNNHIITGLVNALRRIHDVTPIPQIQSTTVQEPSLADILGRGMVADLTGLGLQINIALEAQRKIQEGYAVRATLSSSNVMRHQFETGSDYTEAPDVIGVNILGFKLPELENSPMFCSRIVRAEYDTKETFLADKYSDYFVELPKMSVWTKANSPEQYHELLDYCSIIQAKIKDHERVVQMQAITNPTVLELAEEAQKAVAPSDFVNATLNRKSEMEQLSDYIRMQQRKAAEEAAEKTAEEMILAALRSNFATTVIETMQKSAGITEARLDELKQQAQMA